MLKIVIAAAAAKIIVVIRRIRRVKGKFGSPV